MLKNCEAHSRRILEKYARSYPDHNTFQGSGKIIQLTLEVSHERLISLIWKHGNSANCVSVDLQFKKGLMTSCSGL